MDNRIVAFLLLVNGLSYRVCTVLLRLLVLLTNEHNVGQPQNRIKKKCGGENKKY